MPHWSDRTVWVACPEPLRDNRSQWDANSQPLSCKYDTLPIELPCYQTVLGPKCLALVSGGCQGGQTPGMANVRWKLPGHRLAPHTLLRGLWWSVMICCIQVVQCLGSGNILRLLYLANADLTDAEADTDPDPNPNPNPCPLSVSASLKSASASAK